MDTEMENLNANQFLPSTTKLNRGKKRAISEGDQMLVDEISGIEGTPQTNKPKIKRKKQTNLELRKIAVPAHRFVVYNYFLFLNLCCFLFLFTYFYFFFF